MLQDINVEISTYIQYYILFFDFISLRIYSKDSQKAPTLAPLKRNFKIITDISEHTDHKLY